MRKIFSDAKTRKFSYSRQEFVLIFFLNKTTTPRKCKLCFALKRCNNETHLVT